MNTELHGATLHIQAWKHSRMVKAQRKIIEVACRRFEFTSDDIPHDLLEKPDRNTIGAAFHALAHEGIIEATGEYTSAKKQSRHGAVVRVWRLYSRKLAETWINKNANPTTRAIEVSYQPKQEQLLLI
jgi:hypothetical protein